MASKRAIERAVRRLTMTPAHTDELADKLYKVKRRVYRRSLHELATKLGYDVKRPKLSVQVDAALRAEAGDHAQRITDTYNRDLAEKATDASLVAAVPDSDVESVLRTWAVARQRKRAKPTAITEAYNAHADATIAAFQDLGLSDTRFDFGGHPELGDAAPACAICEALVARNPWPLDAVVRIGNPHPGCRQAWHYQAIDRHQLPDTPHLGQTVAGIVGGDTLITRSGGREEAVAAIEGMAE